MRVGILTQYYLPEIGASQTRLSALAERLTARGHEVVVLTAMPNYPTGRIYPGYGGVYRRETIKGASVLRSWVYPTKRLGMARLVNYFSFVVTSLIVGLARLPRLDFLITDSPPVFLGISGFVLARAKRARWVFNVADLWLDSALLLGATSQGFRMRLARRLESFCYRKAWLVSGQSREIVETIQSRYPGVDVYHLSNGVTTQDFRPDSGRQEIRDRLGGNRQVIAVFAGLHGIAQGLGQILDAAAMLRDVSELTIAFVGDGPDKENLVRLTQDRELDNVRFFDPVPLDEMPSLLASADIAVVPLREHILGQVPAKLYEAMGAGLPVILVAKGEAADIVTEAEAGIVVSPQDIVGLASALRSLAADPSLRDGMGRSGRIAVVAHYDRRKIMDAFVDRLEGTIT